LPGGEWEEVSCPLCPADTGVRLYLSCGDRLVEPGLRNYNLVVCSGCGLIYLSPRPALELAPLHHKQDGYDPFLSFSSPRNLMERTYIIARRLTCAWKRRLMLRFLPPGGSVLDVGCGSGEFLNSIKHIYRVEGIEPEPDAVEFARRKLGLSVQAGILGEVALAADSHNFVTMWHALEHIPQPLEALEIVHSLLKPEGLLLIAVPNIRSFDAEYYAADWAPLDAPRHLWHFQPDSLTAVAQRAGFNRIGSGALPLDPFYNILLSEKSKLRSGSSVWLAPFRISIALTGSLSRGLLRGDHSSIYQVFQKKAA